MHLQKKAFWDMGSAHGSQERYYTLHKFSCDTTFSASRRNYIDNLKESKRAQIVRDQSFLICLTCLEVLTDLRTVVESDQWKAQICSASTSL